MKLECDGPLSNVAFKSNVCRYIEDGIIQYIFDNLGVTDQYFVEFGTESGSETNTRYLREQKGWHGRAMGILLATTSRHGMAFYVSTLTD